MTPIATGGLLARQTIEKVRSRALLLEWRSHEMLYFFTRSLGRFPYRCPSWSGTIAEANTSDVDKAIRMFN
jgi:hypothetical protein